MNDLKRIAEKRPLVSGTLRIGDISEMTGIKVVTLRFYESKGLLPKTAPQGRHRKYNDRILKQLEFITLGRSVGLSLSEIRDFIDVLQGIRPPASRLMKRLRNAATEVDKKIAHLQKVRRLLRNALEDPTEAQF